MDDPGYLPNMAASAMGKYLARVARRAREDAGRKTYDIASTAPGQKRRDPSTVWRFEREETWPRNADEMIDLYAADLGIDPIELWSRALELWRSEENEGQLSEPAPPGPRGVGPAVAPLLEAAESQKRTARGRSAKSRAAQRPRSA